MRAIISETALNTVAYNSENALGTLDHKKAILRDLLEDFEPLSLRPSDIEVKPGQVPADVIGDAYEYMRADYRQHPRTPGLPEYHPSQSLHLGFHGYTYSSWPLPRKNR